MTEHKLKKIANKQHGKLFVKFKNKPRNSPNSQLSEDFGENNDFNLRGISHFSLIPRHS